MKPIKKTQRALRVTLGVCACVCVYVLCECVWNAVIINWSTSAQLWFRFGMRRVASCRVASPKTTSKSISTAAAAATAASTEAVDVCKCCCCCYWCLCFWEPLQHRAKQRLAARVRQLATAALHASLPVNAPVVICILVIVVFVAVVLFIVWWARQFTFL